MVTKEYVRSIVERYQRAWEQRDASLLADIFTADAEYIEHPYRCRLRGLEEIAQYWQDKVVKRQENIVFSLRQIYTDGSTGIVEWECEFDDVEVGCRKRILEIAVMEFAGNKVRHLREYWASTVLGSA